MASYFDATVQNISKPLQISVNFEHLQNYKLRNPHWDADGYIGTLRKKKTTINALLKTLSLLVDTECTPTAVPKLIFNDTQKDLPPTELVWDAVISRPHTQTGIDLVDELKSYICPCTLLNDCTCELITTHRRDCVSPDI